MQVCFEEALTSKIFIQFITLILRSRIYTELKDKCEKILKKPNYMTVPAALSDMMYPNTNYIKFFPTAELPETKNPAYRSGCLRAGTFFVLRRIISEYHLDEMLDRIIGKDSGLFLDIAAYTIIAENNAGQYYPDYAFNHPLFTDNMKVYSDSKVSSFINSITRYQSIAFQDEWNAKQGDMDIRT